MCASVRVDWPDTRSRTLTTPFLRLRSAGETMHRTPGGPRVGNGRWQTCYGGCSRERAPWRARPNLAAAWRDMHASANSSTCADDQSEGTSAKVSLLTFISPMSTCSVTSMSSRIALTSVNSAARQRAAGFGIWKEVSRKCEHASPSLREVEGVLLEGEFDQVGQRLRGMTRDGSSIEAAQVKLIGLDEIREAAGPRWPRMRERVHAGWRPRRWLRRRRHVRWRPAPSAPTVPLTKRVSMMTVRTATT